MELFDSALLLNTIVESLLPVMKWILLAGVIGVAIKVLERTKIGAAFLGICVILFLVNKGVI